MSDATGIPKRTLESYMLKENAAQPGPDALRRLSFGLDISLDWLVCGEGEWAKDAARVARLASRAAVLPHLKTIVAEYRKNTASRFETDTILGLTPEEFAAEIAADAGDKARGIFSVGAPRETMEIVELTMHERDRT